MVANARSASLTAFKTAAPAPGAGLARPLGPELAPERWRHVMADLDDLGGARDVDVAGQRAERQDAAA